MQNIKILQEKLKTHEAFLVVSPTNRFYLTGFNSSMGYLVITNDSAHLFVDFRYFEAAKKCTKNTDVALYSSYDTIKQFLAERDITSLLIENNFITIDAKLTLQKQFGVSVKKSSLSKTLYEMRSVKCEQEIKNIKLAQELTDATFDYILPRIEIGKTEKEIMLDMEFFIRKNGSEGVPFDFIVVSGENSSLPHGVPSDRKIKNGDFITMDFSAVVDGYCSDMTRTVAIGNITDEQKKVYDTVLKAQTAAIKQISAGKKCADIDKIARDIIEKDYKGCFGHSLGHSVGIEVHESPNLSPKSTATLSAFNVVTVEPGIYLENQFGVRIEDMVIVTENGTENITKSKKELIIL